MENFYSSDTLDMTLARSENQVLERVTEFDPDSVAPEDDNSLPPAQVPPLSSADIRPPQQRRPRGRPRITRDSPLPRRRKYKILSEDARDAARGLVREGMTLTGVARIHNVGVATISRIVNEVRPPQKRSESVRKILTPAVSKALAAALEANPEATVSELVPVAAAHNGGIEPSKSYLTTHLRSKKMEQD